MGKSKCRWCRGPVTKQRGIYKVTLKGNLVSELCSSKCLEQFTKPISLTEIKKVEVLSYESRRYRPKNS